MPGRCPDAGAARSRRRRRATSARSTGTLTDPASGRCRRTSRSSSTSTCPASTSARRRSWCSAWARTVIPTAGSPLLYVGEREGQRAAVLAFLPRNSDLPLQVAFPILMANLTGELIGGSAAPTRPSRRAIRSPCRSRAARRSLVVTRPDGSTVELPGDRGRGVRGVQPDGPARRLHGRAVFPDRRPVPPAADAAPTTPADARPRHARARRLADPGPHGAARRPERSGAIRGRPVRPGRERHRAGLAVGDRRARAPAGHPSGDRRSRLPGPREPAPARSPGVRRPAPAAPTSRRSPATSCGSSIVLVVLALPRRGVARLPP